MENHPTHVAILRDGLAEDVVHQSEVLGWFLRHHSYSMDHALRYEGFSIEERKANVNGWMAFYQNVTRRGYGIGGALSRLASAIQDLVNEYDQQFAKYADAAPSPQLWTKYGSTLEGPEIAAMLEAFEALLSSPGPQPGSLAAIFGDLSRWTEITRERIAQ